MNHRDTLKAMNHTDFVKVQAEAEVSYNTLLKYRGWKNGEPAVKPRTETAIKGAIETVADRGQE